MKFLSGRLVNGLAYAQWWASVKLHGLKTQDCVAAIYERDGRFGLNVMPEAPDGILELALEAKAQLEQGHLVPATHTVTWTFGKPSFSEVEA